MKTVQIVNCCGDHLAYVRVKVPKDTDVSQLDHNKILKNNGYRQHQCGSCYDNAYRIKDV